MMKMIKIVRTFAFHPGEIVASCCDARLLSLTLTWSLNKQTGNTFGLVIEQRWRWRWRRTPISPILRMALRKHATARNNSFFSTFHQ
jgi:hypothetical protein